LESDLGVGADGNFGGVGDPTQCSRPIPSPIHVDQVKGKSVITKLNDMVKDTLEKEKVQESNLDEFTQVDSELSSPSAMLSDREKDHPKVIKSKRQKKPTTRLPFPHLVGPKCLRLVEVVNSVSANCRRKKNDQEEETKASKQMDEVTGDGMAETPEVNSDQRNSMMGNTTPPLVVGFQSGVDAILGDDCLEDVDGYAHNRKDPGAQLLEAEQILEIQSDLGLDFHEKKEATVTRLVELEERDRVKLLRSQENHGSQ
jgi:hypothetical protein